VLIFNFYIQSVDNLLFIVCLTTKTKEGVFMKYKKIEDYEWQNIKKGLFYINKYDMSLISIWELNTYWKEFFFDIFNQMCKQDLGMTIISGEESLFDYMKNNYYNIIKKYKLNIDIRDYVEITDYISYNDWIHDNDIAFLKDGIYLIKSE